MGASRKQAQHPRRIVGVARLFENLLVDHDDSVGPQHAPAGERLRHSLLFFARQAARVLNRIFPRKPFFSYVRRMHLDRDAGFAQQLLPARRVRGENKNLFAFGQQASSRSARSVSRYVRTPGSSKGLKSSTMLGASGVSIEGEFSDFRVWAPNARRITLRVTARAGDRGRDLAMRREGDEHFAVRTTVRAGERYYYLVDEHKPVPDPVSRLLPEGVHGPTEIVDPDRFTWSDQAWRGLLLKDYVIYELHVGTFTPQGTLDSSIAKLSYLN